MKNIFTFLVLLVSLSFASTIFATEEISIVIQNHQFEPAEIQIPAGQKVRLIIDNRDSTAEEFESFELNREKIIPGNSKAAIFVGPLKAGRYPFFGEFNQKTAKGILIAK